MNEEEKQLNYPQLRADISLCREYLSKLCEIVWANKDIKIDKSLWSTPPNKKDWDMQFSALINEVEYLREVALLPTYRH